jgi:hypothetical protein
MGTFIYEGGVKIELEDRVLSHLQLVIGAKLRRSEAFYFTWSEDAATGRSRTSVWLHQGSSLVYRYYGSRTPSINLAWIDALALTANSAAGLRIVPEPREDATTDQTA